MPEAAKGPPRKRSDAPCSIVRWSDTRGSFIGKTSLRGTKEAVLLLGVMYPFWGMNGRRFLRTGSGRIVSATKFRSGHSQPGATNWLEHTHCPCPKCEREGGPGDEWWEVAVLTATHVIFDDAEARDSSCRLFYDSEGCPVTSLDGGRVDRVIVDEDTCLVKYFTCDLDLGYKLEGMVKRFNQELQRVTEHYFRFRDTYRLVFIVSHPHGLAKHVSVGRWKDKCTVGEVQGLTRFTYTTSTCRGSSGAQVLFIGYTSEQWRFQHVHCGTLDSVVNFSGTGYVLTSVG
ncbi:hypothetical protein Btru_023149 [Bulinus truncatus]|nr:hypothetical protein Btru_023149 [Bulinus truncatus]